MLYPFIFKPIFQERIWGGRELVRLYHKRLPVQGSFGESWEISDRPGAESEIATGPLAGKTLRWLMEHHRLELLGRAKPLDGRFPLLVKILDAREKLSLQVHPPPFKAAALGGDPKTEMWYITQADPGAVLHVGLKKNVTPEAFKRHLSNGTVADCVQSIEVQAGDAMFLPSGRLHAIGAGLVLFEIQQNSDTTYRVFDWNRLDSSGKPRPLHVSESLECIDFQDFEPQPIRAEPAEAETASVRVRPLVENPLFKVEVVSTLPGAHLDYSLEAPRVIGVVSGTVAVTHPEHPLTLGPGDFALVPAAMGRVVIEVPDASEFLVAQPGYEDGPLG